MVSIDLNKLRHTRLTLDMLQQRLRGCTAGRVKE
jgi:uncharacterized membrane protein YcaP (DUF421 family)